MPAAFHPPKHQLKVNAYDRASSWLVALLIIGTITVAGLLIVYFARQFLARERAVAVNPVDAASRPADAAMGLKRDLEPPGIEDVPELLQPQLQDTLSALSSAVAARTAILSDEDIDSVTEPGHGRGLGDNRRAGFGDGVDGVEEPKRELRCDPASLSQYAQMLDFFQIELAVLDQADNQVYYAYNLSREVPSVRIGKPQDERRLSMIPTSGPLPALDRRLAAKASIANRGGIVMQFYPNEAAGILYQLEQQYATAQNRKTGEIRRTVFRITPNGDRFEFSVAEQLYHAR
jgi:hypothetical protein